ncbi:MAG: ABC transporter permease [Cellulomonas sp.]
MNHQISTVSDAKALAAIQEDLRQAPPGDEASIAAAARARGRRRRVQVQAARAAAVVVIVGGWQLFTTLKIVDPFFFGQPTGIAHQLVDWVQNGTPYGSLWLQIEVTMKEALGGFVYGTLAGIVLGVLLGQVPFLADVLGPFIKVLNAVPRIVLGSIFVVWLGFGPTSKILLASVLVFFVVFFNAFQGVREVDRNLLANVRVLGASRSQVIRDVVLPSAVVWIIASLHVAFGFAIIGAIVGEFLGSQEGLGLLISYSQNHFLPDGIFTAMFIIAVIALTAEGLISQLEKRLLSWRPGTHVETAGL